MLKNNFDLLQDKQIQHVFHI